jgi:hypothetical protein
MRGIELRDWQARVMLFLTRWVSADSDQIQPTGSVQIVAQIAVIRFFLAQLNTARSSTGKRRLVIILSSGRRWGP